MSAHVVVRTGSSGCIEPERKKPTDTALGARVRPHRLAAVGGRIFARADLERLLHFRSREAPVVSLYVAFPKEQGLRGMKARLRSILKPVQDLADSDELPPTLRA
jgi:hypothetical protein